MRVNWDVVKMNLYQQKYMQVESAVNKRNAYLSVTISPAVPADGR
jgi:hypothetical protein